MSSRRDRIGLDSSFLIALVSGWHVHHTKTIARYEHLLASRADLIVPVHGLFECYAVLTRLPSPFRSTPDTARQAIEESFYRTATIVGLTSKTAWNTIDSFSREGIGGGRIYDAAIAACLADAGATILYTWNVRDFAALALPDLAIREP